MGLLAAKVVTATAKTAFVGALLSDGETIVGSARTAARDGHNVFEVLQACQSSLKKFGGHPQAAGFELSIHQAEEFQLALETFFSQQSLKDLPDAVHLQPDLFVDIRESLEILSWYERLEPFGIGFLPPVVAFKDIEVGEIRPLKGNHFRLKLIDQKGGILTALLFDHSAEPPSPQGHYQMVGEMQWNEFRGQKTPQLLVKEFCESYCEKIAPVTI